MLTFLLFFSVEHLAFHMHGTMNLLKIKFGKRKKNLDKMRYYFFFCPKS